MCIERFLDDNLNAPDDISRLKGLLLEGNIIDHVTVAIKFESGADIKEAIQKHLANDIWESIYDTLVSSKDSITLETIEMLHSNIDAFYKREVTREVKPFKRRNLILGINNQTMNQRQSNQLPFLVCRTSAI